MNKKYYKEIHDCIIFSIFVVGFVGAMVVGALVLG